MSTLKKRYIPDPDWEQVIYNGSTYFCNRKTQESRWSPKYIVAPELSKTSSANALKKNRRRSAAVVDRRHIPIENDTDEEDNDLDEPQWTVKLHPDSGQPYFRNQITRVDMWSNPWSLGNIDFGAEKLAQALEEMERVQHGGGMELMGDEDITGRSVAPVSSEVDFETDEEYQLTHQKLLAWTQRREIKVTGERSIKLKWPEYVDLYRNLEESAAGDCVYSDKLVNCQICMNPSAIPKGKEPFYSRPFKLTDQVEDVLDFAKMRYQVEWAGSQTQCILKVCGYKEYLLHKEFQLGCYDCLAQAARFRRIVKLEFKILDEVEFLELGPFLNQSEEEVRHKQEVEASGTPEDRWDIQDEDESSNSHMLWKNMTYIPFDEVEWPFQVMVKGVSDLPLELLQDFDMYAVEVGLYYCGKELITRGNKSSHARRQRLDVTPCVVAPVLHGNAGTREIKFPQVHMPRLNKIPINSLPPTTRIGFMLVGYDEDSNAKGIAGVAITLCDYRRHLVTGDHTLRLWPTPVLQCARDPTLEKIAIPFSLNRCVVGENCDQNYQSPTLHVSFNKFMLPVVAKQVTIDNVVKEHKLRRLSFTRQTRRMKIRQPPVLRELTPDRRGREKSMKEKGNDLESTQENSLKQVERKENPISQRDKKRAEELAQNDDPLQLLTRDDYKLIVKHKDSICHLQEFLLPRYLQTVDWSNKSQVQEAHKLICNWKAYPPKRTLDYLELLDIRYNDPVIREFVVIKLCKIADAELELFLLQLVQALKYEPYHDSPLARFLIRRALQNPGRIGQRLYWLLFSEMHEAEVCKRFGVLLVVYLTRCGQHRKDLKAQLKVNNILREIAEQAVAKTKNKRTEYAREELRIRESMNMFPSSFTLCISQRVECSGLRIHKCKVMSSKKAPLWLVFENADPMGNDYYAIFKYGDDLRQDMITLQMLQFMDKIWIEEEGLDLLPTPYGCISTGPELGMIEVVQNAATTSEIQQKYGGRIVGAFRVEPINQYLTSCSEGHEHLRYSVENFVRSCAGYCVATYVLGIGDRHSDNIMVTETGHLFHIDFGHFLGNFKSKYGIRRERAPFVFTPEMKYVIEAEMVASLDNQYRQFKGFCCQAYNLIRERSRLFINLFQLMIPAYVPELLSPEDITYLQKQMCLHLTPGEASEHFEIEIKNSLNSVSRRVDNFIHNLKQQHVK